MGRCENYALNWLPERLSMTEPRFPLRVLEDGRQVHLHRVVRHLEGKREVAEGALEGTPVICKTYFADQPAARRQWRRECRGLAQLRNARIRTPRIVFQGRERSCGDYLLITEQLVAAPTYAQLLASPVPDPQLAVHLLGLVELLAQMHGAGILQEDVHLGNFLLSADQTYAIDGGGIRLLPRMTGGRQAARNLALLLAQLPLGYASLLDGLIERYLAVSVVLPAPAPVMLRKRIDQARFRRDRHATRKLYRDCSDIRVFRHWGRFVASARGEKGEQLADLLRNPDQWMEERRDQLLKPGNSATVVRCKVDGRYLVIKRYNLKNFAHRLQRMFRASRASRSWANAHRLLRWGIATPRPVAMIEERWGPLRGRAFFISEWVDGLALSEVVRRGGNNSPAVADQLGGFLHGMILLRCCHGDMKSDNFLVHDNRLWILDLDSMRQWHQAAKLRRELAADVRRLANNRDMDNGFLARVVASAEQRFDDYGPFPFPAPPELGAA